MPEAAPAPVATPTPAPSAPAPGEPAATGGEPAPSGEVKPNATPSQEEWVASLDPAGKAALESYTLGLKNSLKSQSDDARKLRDEVKRLSEQKDGVTKEQLEELSKKLDLADKRAAFYEDAMQQGCKNVRLAWLAAEQDQSFDRYGKTDWSHLRASYPELFSTTVAPPGAAGAGTGTPPPMKVGMEQLIRRAAGAPLS